MLNVEQAKRFRLLIYLGLGAVALIILAGGMSNLDLQTGQIIMEPIEETQLILEDKEAPEPAPVFVDPLNVTTILLLGGLALFILFAAVRWKQIRATLLVLGLFTASIIGLIYLYSQYGNPPQETTEEETRPPALQEVRIDADLLNNPPDWLDSISVIVAVGIAVIAVAVVIFIIRRPWQKDNRTLDMIAAEAEAALANIRSGGDLRDAVLRCYFEMSQGLRKSMGIVREEGMTPREFESALTDSGLPTNSVHRLTRLFESVRYGRHEASEGEIREAVDSLEEIIAASQKRQVDSDQSRIRPQFASH
ncbi:MAG: hypothetical protein BMS9Abin02_0420 [Anaerolineae bacterium]|nr:MAG: hypothetical protein BMS9Abin02_0420 [Anaerolineae bacterium]